MIRSAVKQNFPVLIIWFTLSLLNNMLISHEVIAQDKTSKIEIHGHNELTGQYSNNKSANSQIPNEFIRNNFQMNMTYREIPIGTRFFISTDQNDSEKRFDNLSFYIDLIALKKNKKRLEAKNQSKTRDYTKVPWMLRFLSNFSKIEAGKFRPNYNDLILDGISVSGVNIEFTQKTIYAAFASGRIKRSTEGNYLFDQTYNKKLMFGKIGLGDKNRTHFYVTYMHIADENSEFTGNSESNFNTLKPQSNQIIGTELRLSFLNAKLIIDGNAGFACLTRDIRNTIKYDSMGIVSPFIEDAINANITTSFDIAYDVRTKLNLRSMTISGGYRMIGPGYKSLGNPNLINDQRAIDLRIDKAFLKRRISVSTFYKRFQNNLINWERGTTISTTLGIITRISFNNAPYFQISVTPSQQNTTGYTNSSRNYVNVISTSTGYNYSLGKLFSTTSLSYFKQNTEYHRDTIKGFIKTQTITLNQSLSFSVPLTLNFNASYSNMKKTEFNRDIISAVISITHQVVRMKWKNTLGCKNMHMYGEFDQNKFSLFWDTSINLWKGMDFGLNLDENIIRNKISVSRNQNEFLMQCRLILHW